MRILIMSLIFAASTMAREMKKIEIKKLDFSRKKSKLTLYEKHQRRLDKATKHREKLMKDARELRRSFQGIDMRQVPKKMRGSLYQKYWAFWSAKITNLPAIDAVPWNPPSLLRIISEVRLPYGTKQAENLTAEMSWAKNEGYNGVHVVWRNGDDPEKLAALAQQFKADGWWMLLSIGPEESSTVTSYIPPEQIQTMLAAVLPHCDAFLPGWRMSSPPHWSGDNAAYPTVLASMAREVCSAIPVLGNVFVKQTQEILTGIPSGASAVVVQGVGYRRVRPKGVRKLVETVTDLPLITLVMGPPPYYWSFHNIKIDKKEVMAQKQAVERRFQGAGFGTLTMAGDGADGRNRYGSYDDLARTNWNEVDNKNENEKQEKSK